LPEKGEREENRPIPGKLGVRRYISLRENRQPVLKTPSSLITIC
jgi:hypothetical protein